QKSLAKARLFNLIRPTDGLNPLLRMKSLRDEIRTSCGLKRTDLISSVAEATDFIRALIGFHRGIAAISLLVCST
ncbi:MAG: hypothetical protein IKZ81_03005, partial [Clostridia bacterium]|nr:hypothetical protein [Clostridia bacterium]